MSALEIVGAVTLAAIGCGLLWVAWEFAVYFGRGIYRALRVAKVHLEQGETVHWWRLPVVAWGLASADSVTLIGSGRTIVFRNICEDEGDDE